VPSKPKILDKVREVASSIWNLCKHVQINVAKKVVNSALSLFPSKDKALPQPEYEEQQHELEYKEPPFVLIKSDSALKDFVEQYTIDGRPRYDPESLLKAVKEVVTNELQSHRQTKVKLILKCMMKETNMVTGEETIVEAVFHSDVEINLEGSDVNEIYDGMVEKVPDNLSTFQRRDSGWVFASIVRLEIHTENYESLRGSSYIPLPKQLMSKKAIINHKNEDNECFKWAVTRAVHPVDHNAEQISIILRKQAETLNWENINFPMPRKDITKFEKQNPSISVNVFGYEGGIYPLRISEQPEGTIHVDLFLIANEEGMQHYCWINDKNCSLTIVLTAIDQKLQKS